MEGQQGVLTVQVREVVPGDRDMTDMGGRLSGPFMELMVKDTGCGIDQETQKHMFESYFTTRGVDKGSGLGLAIVQEIVKASEGTIFCESEPGLGTTFRVYFPKIQEQDHATVRTAESSPSEDDTEVLIVDPDKTIIEMYSIYLESIGYTVKGSSDLERILEYIQANPHKVKLMTIDQAISNLMETKFIEEVVKIHPDLPVILFTDQGGLGAESGAMFPGVRQCRMKPVSGSELAATVKKVLEEAEAMRNIPAAG